MIQDVVALEGDTRPTVDLGAPVTGEAASPAIAVPGNMPNLRAGRLAWPRRPGGHGSNAGEFAGARRSIMGIPTEESR